MVKKIPSALATALLAAFMSTNVAAATEQQALAQLDRTAAKNTEARQTARAELSALVKAGVPVDQALEVVRSGAEKGYSAGDLRQVSGEIRDQVQQGIPAEQVTKIADRAIDAGYSASATQKALNTFEARVENGMPAAQAYTRSSSEIVLNSQSARSAMGPNTGMGVGTGAGAGAGMGPNTGMGAGAGFGAGAGMGNR